MVPYDGQVHLQQDEDPLTPSLRIGEGGDSVPSPPILGSNEGEVGGDRWSEAVGGARPACYEWKKSEALRVGRVKSGFCGKWRLK